ncbi:hypothetical protein Taro_026780, partial [Colocasia esculenta]|nr:hypothetical protein [Colocasia esculenta]
LLPLPPLFASASSPLAGAPACTSSSHRCWWKEQRPPPLPSPRATVMPFFSSRWRLHLLLSLQLQPPLLSPLQAPAGQARKRGRGDCGHNSAMAATAHTSGVFFGPLVVQDHIRNSYLTTPTRFGDFLPVVESPYFLDVIPVVLPTAAKAHEAKQAKKEPQAQEANLIQMFATYTINFVDTPTTGKNKRRKSSKKPTTRGISGSGKAVRVGDLRICLDGSETLMIPERHVATIPVKNSFGILPKVRNGNARKSEAKGYVGKPYATNGNGVTTATTTITTNTTSTAGTTTVAASASSTNNPANIAYSGTPAWQCATKYTPCRICG